MSDNFAEESLTSVEWKTLTKILVWNEAPAEWEVYEGAHRAEVLRRRFSEICKSLRKSVAYSTRFFALLKRCFKTTVAVSYVKLVALRGLQRMRILLRQKLASSAPVERLILRNRVRHLFATRQPIAPPQFA